MNHAMLAMIASATETGRPACSRGGEFIIAISCPGVEGQKALLRLAKQRISFLSEAAAVFTCRESPEAITNLRSSHDCRIQLVTRDVRKPGVNVRSIGHQGRHDLCVETIMSQT
jgi:hypothetical protein